MRRVAFLRGASLLALGFGLGWAASALRFGPPTRPDRRAPPPLPDVEAFSSLGLDPGQLDRIEAITSEGRERERELAATLESARRDLEEAVDSSQDIPSLRTKYDAVIAAKNALERNHFETMMQIHAVLTMDQIRALRRRRPRGPPRRPPG